MLRRAPRWLVRCKHGQTAWSPNTTSSGAAPTNGVTAQEALQIAYRPMPLANTVEYEEDFGASMMIHREYVSPKNRSRMSHDISSLAYSDVELTKARQQLAGVMNRERRGVVVGMSGEPGDRVHFNSDVDETTREVKSARFLFNEQRMQFCERFQNFFRERIERSQQRLSGLSDAGEDKHYYFSLMEACAVLYGCDTAAARETYYHRFLRLDLDSLAAEEAGTRERAAAAAEVASQLLSTESGDREDTLVLQAATPGTEEDSNYRGTRQTAQSSTEVVQEIIDALPPLFPETAAVKTGRGADSAPQAVLELSSVEQGASTAAASQASAADASHFAEDVAPLFRAYLAHSRGESRVGSYDVTTVGAHAVWAERRRWRSLMEKITNEDYHNLTPSELEDAYVLNQQLHTVKFFDLKIGDTVGEILQRLRQETGSSASGDRDTPLERSPTHPERRV